MNINRNPIDTNYVDDIILEIEKEYDPSDRVIAYASIMVYLAELSDVIVFKQSRVPRRNQINEGLRLKILSMIERDINKFKAIMDTNIKR